MLPVGADLPAEDDEAALVALYAQAPGTVRLGMIAGRDGAAAGPDGSSRSLNGPGDLRVLRALRANADVVLVGGETARVERYGRIALPEPMRAARVAAGLTPVPVLAVVSASGSLPDSLDGVDDAVVVGAGTVLSAAEVVDAAAGSGLGRVLCEGGPRLAALLLDAGLIDDYCLTRSPLAGGAAQPRTPLLPAGARLTHRFEGDGFAMERWLLSKYFRDMQPRR